MEVQIDQQCDKWKRDSPRGCGVQIQACYRTVLAHLSALAQSLTPLDSGSSFISKMNDKVSLSSSMVLHGRLGEI